MNAERSTLSPRCRAVAAGNAQRSAKAGTHLIAKAREITEFCLAHGGRCFQGWDTKTLFTYVFFHLVDGGCFQSRTGVPPVPPRPAATARQRGECDGATARRVRQAQSAASPGIAALMFAWGAPSSEILERSRNGQSPFAWRRSRNHADALFLAEVIGDRRDTPRLLKLAAAKWPDWQRRRIFTYRDGRLVELSPSLLKRMAGEDRPAPPRPGRTAQRPDTAAPRPSRSTLHASPS